MYYFKSNNIEYRFRFIKLGDNTFVDFRSKRFFDENPLTITMNGYLFIRDKEIMWQEYDPATFSSEAKDYMNRMLKLMVFS